MSTEITGVSLADLLAQRRALPESEARGVGAHVARAIADLHEQSLIHGDIKASNVVFVPDGDLGLIGFDTTAQTDDVIALAVMVVECATTVVIDEASRWDVVGLVEVGCPHDLAGDIALILRDTPAATRVSGILQRRDDRLPEAPRHGDSTDPSPTVDIPSVAIVGLSPMGTATPPCEPAAPRGWRRWASGGRG